MSQAGHPSQGVSLMSQAGHPSHGFLSCPNSDYTRPVLYEDIRYIEL